MAEENAVGYPPPPFFVKHFLTCTADPPAPPDEIKIFGQDIDPHKSKGNSVAGNTEDLLQSLSEKNKKALQLFLELLSTLTSQPASYSRVVMEINKVMTELQEGVSHLRAFQARATLEYALTIEEQQKQSNLERLAKEVTAALSGISHVTHLVKDHL